MKYIQSQSKEQLIGVTKQLCQVLTRAKGVEFTPPNEEEIFTRDGMFVVGTEFLQGLTRFPMPHHIREMFVEE